MNGGVYELDFVASNPYGLVCPSLNNSSVEKDLKDLKELYYERNSVALDDAVSKETTRDYKKFLLTLLNNSSVEKDLKDLKELYYERNSVALDHAVSKETTGDYKKFLLTLFGKED
ncbi:annexin-like protein rj4 [Quercus suber]|uniref:Annexin-like protein rj4 n=1 Tax=Quercus suber TaxID=58331 RepID=A0AAW0KLI7_QUESU